MKTRAGGRSTGGWRRAMSSMAMGGLRVLHLPGHTPGSIALYSEKRKVLFCGDTLGNRDDTLSPPFQYKYHKQECDATFARLAEMDIEAVLPGHGPPILNNANERIREFSKKQRAG